MTSSPITSDDRQPREWSIAGRTLILSAADHRALAVLNGGDPLLLPPGSVLQFGDPPGELVVTRIRVILGEDGAVVCAETEPAPQADLRRSSAAPARPAPPPGHLRPVPAQIPWSQVRPGNGLPLAAGNQVVLNVLRTASHLFARDLALTADRPLP